MGGKGGGGGSLGSKIGGNVLEPLGVSSGTARKAGGAGDPFSAIFGKGGEDPSFRSIGVSNFGLDPEALAAIEQFRERFQTANLFIMGAEEPVKRGVTRREVGPIFEGFKDQIETEFDAAAMNIAEGAPVGGQRRAQETQLRGQRAQGLAGGRRAQLEAEAAADFEFANARSAAEVEFNRAKMQDAFGRAQLLTQLGIAGLGIPQLLISGTTAGQQIDASARISEAGLRSQEDIAAGQKKKQGSSNAGGAALLAASLLL